MKQWKWILLAIVVVLGLARWTARQARQQPVPEPVVATARPADPAMADTPATAPEPESVEAPEPQAATPAPEAAEASSPPPVMAAAEMTVPSTVIGNVDNLRSGQALAKVNGVEITLQDLMALTPNDNQERSLRADAYNHLLDLAIERELTFQAARARGIELDEAQKQNLEALKESALARAGAPYMPADYDAEAQAAFEVRLGTALMLQNRLLGEDASPTVAATPEMIREYYEAHAAEFPALPEEAAAREQAWQSIEMEIGNQLVAKIYLQREQKRRQLLKQLTAEAAIQPLVGPTGD